MVEITTSITKFVSAPSLTMSWAGLSQSDVIGRAQSKMAEINLMNRKQNKQNHVRGKKYLVSGTSVVLLVNISKISFVLSTLSL